MNDVVLDASVVVAALARHPGGAARLGELRADGARFHAPELLDVEVAHALRRLERLGHVSPERAAVALERLRTLRIVRWPHTGLLRRVWAHREQLSAYDAVYAALAESIPATLVTRDRGLAGAALSVKTVRFT